MSSTKIFISAGESSGDIYSAKLAEELLKTDPSIEIKAIGGDRVESAGASLLYHIRNTAFMGFAEVVKHLPSIWKIWRSTIKYIESEKPELIILVDYPGFNLRLAKAAYKRGISVIYYISPQVWAWNQSRVKKIRKYTKEVLCIFPFEVEWYHGKGVNAEFIGHPLLDIYDFDMNDSGKRIIGEKKHLLGLFPGSRQQEVDKHLDIMIKAVYGLRDRDDSYEAAIAIAPDVEVEKYRQLYPYNWLHWIENSNHTIMKQSDLLIMSSGTATVEAALHQTPMIVIYRVSPISYWLGKRLIKVPYIAMVNLIGGKKGVPELIQNEATPENIIAEVEKLLDTPSVKNETDLFLKSVKTSLGSAGASRRAADIIYRYLK